MDTRPILSPVTSPYMYCGSRIWSQTIYCPVATIFSHGIRPRDQLTEVRTVMKGCRLGIRRVRHRSNMDRINLFEHIANLQRPSREFSNGSEKIPTTSRSVMLASTTVMRPKEVNTDRREYPTSRSFFHHPERQPSVSIRL